MVYIILETIFGRGLEKAKKSMNFKEKKIDFLAKDPYNVDISNNSGGELSRGSGILVFLCLFEGNRVNLSNAYKKDESY